MAYSSRVEFQDLQRVKSDKLRCDYAGNNSRRDSVSMNTHRGKVARAARAIEPQLSSQVLARSGRLFVLQVLGLTEPKTSPLYTSPVYVPMWRSMYSLRHFVELNQRSHVWRSRWAVRHYYLTNPYIVVRHQSAYTRMFHRLCHSLRHFPFSRTMAMRHCATAAILPARPTVPNILARLQQRSRALARRLQQRRA